MAVRSIDTDGQAVLGADNTLTSGVGSFAVTFAGSQTVTATGSIGAITGSQSVTISPAAIDHFVVSAPASATAGSPITVIVTAKDAYGNTKTNYTGTIHFTSSDGAAVLPANYTFLVGDAGAHTFTSEVTLKTAGVQTVSVNDTVTTAAIGTSSDITVNPAALASITVSPSSASIAAGDSQPYTAEGFDSHGNSLGDVTSGTTFSIDGAGTCGTASCGSNVAGSYTVTGTDGAFSDTASLTVTPGGLAAITVSPSSASIAAGDSQPYTAEGFDSHGNSLGDVTSGTTFRHRRGGHLRHRQLRLQRGRQLHRHRHRRRLQRHRQPDRHPRWPGGHHRQPLERQHRRRRLPALHR